MAKRFPEVKDTPNTPYPEKRSSFPLGSLAPCSNLSTRSFGSAMFPPSALSVGDGPTVPNRISQVSRFPRRVWLDSCIVDPSKAQRMSQMYYFCLLNGCWCLEPASSLLYSPSCREGFFSETQIGMLGVTSSAEAVSLIRPQLRYGHSREKVPYLGPTRRPPHK